MYKLNPYSGQMDLIDIETNMVQVSRDLSTIGYHSIKEAMESIIDASLSNPYIIKVAPGQYYEDEIEMKQWVSIIGDDPFTTQIYANSGVTSLFNFYSIGGITRTSLEGISLFATSSTTKLINMENEGILSLNKIELNQCKIGLLVNHSDAQVWIQNCSVDCTNATPIEDVIKVTAGRIFSRSFHVIKSANVSNLFSCIGADSEIDSSNLTAHSPLGGVVGTNKVETVFNISDGGIIRNMDSILENCSVFLSIDNTGSGSTFIGRSIQMEPADWAIYNLSASAEINMIGVNLERGQIHSACDINIIGYDSTSEKFRTVGSSAIGMPGQGSSLHVGEGGSYKFGIKTLTFDGTSTYAEIDDGDDIEFSALTAGACIYFGDINSFKFYGLSYIMGATPIALGTGEVIWEYYDGGTTAWTAFKTLNTLTDYSNSYDGSCFDGTADLEYTIRFDQNIKNGVKEISLSSTGNAEVAVNSITGMWVRCRIDSDITTSPVFSTPRFKGNYKAIRVNGTESYQGESRCIQNISLPFGDSAAGGTSKTLAISSSISYPYWNNSLVDGATNQLYFRFVITENIDTSCGLLLKYLCSTPYTGGADLTGIIKIYSSKVKNGDAFGGANDEVVQDSNFIYTASDAADLAHFCTSVNRIDISDMKEDDVVFIMIERIGADAGDTLTNSIDFANVWIECRDWQKGRNLV